MADNAVAEEGIHTVPGSIEELVGDHEVQRLVFFFQRTNRGHGDDPLHTQLLEAVYVRAKIQLRGQDVMPSPMPRQEGDLAAFKRAKDVGVRRLTEGCLQADFPDLAEPGHGVKPAAANDADFRLRQESP